MILGTRKNSPLRSGAFASMRSAERIARLVLPHHVGHGHGPGGGRHAFGIEGAELVDIGEDPVELPAHALLLDVGQGEAGSRATLSTSSW
jgi:hypothetical protein